MNEPYERLTGCIPASVQAAAALRAGVKSDVDAIAELAAPWDGEEQPSIIEWDSAWRQHLEKEAEAFDAMRLAGQLPPVWDIAALAGYSLEELCQKIQRRNDCTGWGTTRAAVCLALFQYWMGAEINVERYNPSGIYVYASGDTPRSGRRVADNGRTIYAIAKCACEVGNFPASAIGEYTGETWFTDEMIDAEPIAKKNQMGFVYVSQRMSAEQLADLVILSLRACRPVIIGNDIALRDGTHVNADGVYISNVSGGWGGGHCTAAVDVKLINGNYYPWIYNSHGDLYSSGDGAPAAGTYVSREGLIRYFSGSFCDVMPTTYIKRPRVTNEEWGRK